MTYIPGADALAMMRKRLARDRKAAEGEIAQLKPLTVSRFDGCERFQPDEDACNAMAKLEALLDALKQAEETLT